MIKSNKPTARVLVAPREDYEEVKCAYGINWCFMDIYMLPKNIKAPTFWNIHKLLENATRKQLRKER